MSRRQLTVAVALIAVGLAFRLAVVHGAHGAPPDGRQYEKLARALRDEHRYAFDAAPSWTRLPGYPLLLAFGVPARLGGPWFDELGCVENVLFDAGTALCLLLLLVELRRPRAGLIALGIVLGFPLLFLCTTYVLTESFATFLLALELYLAIRAGRRRSLVAALAVGAVAGAAQLVRADALTLWPAALLALLASADRRRAAALVGGFALGGVLVFAPWPARNLIRFGAAHPVGAEWLRQDGQPLRAGLIAWMRTWCTAEPGQATLANMIVFGWPVSSRSPGVMRPEMADSPPERQRLAALLDRVGGEGLSSEVDAEFRALAAERMRRAPWRTLVRLPLRRALHLFEPPPAAELPLKLGWLLQPRGRFVFGVADVLLYLLALVGAVRLARRERYLLAVLLLTIAARVAVHAFAVPHFAGQRYLVEAFPALIALAAIGVSREQAQGSDLRDASSDEGAGP